MIRKFKYDIVAREGLANLTGKFVNINNLNKNVRLKESYYEQTC